MEIKLGERLKELRVENGYTQKEIAALLNINSVTYLRYEKNQREPALQLLVQLALFYSVSVDYLLGLTEY